MNYVTSYPIDGPTDGVSRQVLAQTPDLMVVAFTFDKGGKGALHSHPHTQSTYVESGCFRFTINDESFTVNAGDSFIIPANAIHGCICIKAGRLIDTFTPRRDDFL